VDVDERPLDRFEDRAPCRIDSPCALSKEAVGGSAVTLGVGRPWAESRRREVRLVRGLSELVATGEMVVEEGLLPLPLELLFPILSGQQ